MSRELRWRLTILLSTADAAVMVVDTTADDVAPNANCTLREAVIAANSDLAVDNCPAGDPGLDTIRLSAATYTLSIAGGGEDAALSGDLDLTSDIAIVGVDAATTIIDAAGIDRVIDVDPTGNGITASLTAVTIRGGRLSESPSQGAGVRNAGTLSVTDSVITANSIPFLATPNAAGGGIYSSGMLELTRSSVSDNVLFAGMPPNPFSSGLGGGIASLGPAIVTDSTIAGNYLEVNAATSGSGAGGGIWGASSLTINGSAIVENTITSSTNIVVTGGGIHSDDPTLSNSTVSDNDAVTSGVSAVGVAGALFISGDATISNCTIAGNSSDLSSEVVLQGTTTFRNTIVQDTCHVSGTVVANAYNLNSNVSCGFSGTDLVNTDPLLGPLQNNGGPTVTRLPDANSPALEGGSPAAPGSGGNSCTATDQRGVTRPQFARCDIGSVEVEDLSPCADPPLSGCDAPGKSLLLIKDRNGDGAGGGDKLIWKWLKGPPTQQADFGDPTDTTDYTLCVYAGTAAVLRAEVPAGGTCGSAPCWKAISDKGYKRTDTAASSDGIKKILLKGSTGASSKILFKGQGAALDLDAATLPLDDSAGLTVQVSNTDNGNCWQATYGAANVKTNSESVFKAKTP